MKKSTYLKKTFRILGVGWICAFRGSLFISWLSTGTWEVIWCFCIEIMSCHLLCSKLLLTLPCDVAWGSVFFLPGFWTPLAKQYQGQGIIHVWMKIGKRCRERHCGDARNRSSVIMGTPDTNRFANQKAFLYSCYQNGLFFQQQELGKPEQSSPRRHNSWVFSKLCNHCQCFKLSNSSEFVCWLLMEKN